MSLLFLFTFCRRDNGNIRTNMSIDNVESYPRITFDVDGPLLSHFFLLLQQGVTIRRRVGCSVMTFLRKEMEIDPETIENIQSIFVDGAAVDDLE